MHTTRLLLKHEPRLLGLMLASLLSALAVIDEVALYKSLLIVHFGLFLLWQPVMKRETSFSIKDLFILLIFTACFIIWFNIWIGTFWILLLMTLLTGRIFARGITRAAYGIAVIILFLEITLIITPQLFNIGALSDANAGHLQMMLIGASLLLLFNPSDESQTTHVDFIRGLMIVLLTLFLCMGSVLSTYNTENQYLPSLATTLLIAALFMLAAALLWSPRAGFTGLAQLWEKYLLNIGGPFEQWVSQLAALEANTNIKPDGFLETCIDYLVERNWIKGIYWKSARQEVLKGENSKHHVSYNDPKLRITLYAYSPVGPALLLHTKLLLSVLTFYYRAKLQEEQLIKQAHLRAIYETGSKLTHDIKNILQSTQTLTMVITDEETPIEDARRMLNSQLPLLSQRLRTTLDKLSTPQLLDAESKPLSNWWQQLKGRYSGRHIDFAYQGELDQEIPLEIFDTVIENLLDNARTKRIQHPDITIDVHMEIEGDGVTIDVTDSGQAVDEGIAEHLFHEVISSENGFGIGLYQSRQIARRKGYDLHLAENEDGRVRFRFNSI